MVEVEFGFEQYSLDMGRIRRGQRVTKTAVLLLKDLTKRNQIEVSSKSPHLTVRVVDFPAGSEGPLEIEVAVSPKTPPGRINEIVTARVTDDAYPAVSLQVRGSVTGNVEVAPEAVRFTVDTSRSVADQAAQKLSVFCTQNGVSLRLLGVEDANGQLDFEIDTLVVDKQYEITVRIRENALELGRNISGEVRILTNDTEQPEVRVPYSVFFPRQ